MGPRTALPMLLTIPDLITPDELRHIQSALDAAPWIDGRETAGDLAARSKRNAQIAGDSPQALALGEVVMRALARSPAYNAAVLPLRILPPMFNRYDAGMTFGAHTDNAIRAVPGPNGFRLRADVSSTLFLSPPESYEGGELQIEGTYGLQSVKLPAGHLVLYPSSSLHQVTPVTGGSRRAAVLWAQSLVRDDAQRAMLYDLDMAIIDLRSRIGDDDPAVRRLANHYHNLLRRWAEL